MVYLRMRSALNEPIWYGSGGQVHPGDGREHGSSGAGVQPWSAGHLSSAAASGQAFLGGPPAFVGAGASLSYSPFLGNILEGFDLVSR